MRSRIGRKCILVCISVSEKISGRFLQPDGPRRRAGVTIAEGRIQRVRRAPAPGAGTDYGDALLLPGAVDVHVHTRSYAEEGIERVHARRGRRRRDDDRRHALRRRRARSTRRRRSRPRSPTSSARRSSTSRCGRPSRRAGRSSDVGDLVDAGAAAFKLSTFETHPQRFPRIPDAQLLRAFAAIAPAGGLAGVHAENDEIVRAGIAAEQAAGHGGDPLAHARSRPPVAEHEAIARCLELARATGVRLHVCHVSTPRGVELVTAARARRASTSAPRPARTTCCSTSPSSSRSRRRGQDQPAAARAPRCRADGLDLISSDHVGWPLERKHGPDIFALASGAPGRRADRAAGPRRARRRRARPARQRAAGPALRAVAAQGQPPARRRRRPARARPRRRVGDRPGARWSRPAGWSPYSGRRLRGARDRRLLAAARRSGTASACSREPGDGALRAGGRNRVTARATLEAHA